MDIVTYSVIFVTIILLLLLLSMVWPPNSPWSPWWRTNTRRARLICKRVKLDKNDIIYDLGSGDGTLLITAAKEFGARAIGVEIDPLRVWISRILVFFKGLNKKIRIVRKNFFRADISEATIVFMYLVPKALEALKPKLLKELKPGTKIVTFVYKIDLPIIDEDLKNEIYVYEVPGNKK